MVGLSDPHEAKWINFPGRINHFLKESLRELEASKEAEDPKSGVDQFGSGPDLGQTWTRSGPDLDQVRPRSGPDLVQIRGQIWTRSGPDLDPEWDPIGVPFGIPHGTQLGSLRGAASGTAGGAESTPGHGAMFTPFFQDRWGGLWI